jgi:hypothetical protein
MKNNRMLSVTGKIYLTKHSDMDFIDKIRLNILCILNYFILNMNLLCILNYY